MSNKRNQTTSVSRSERRDLRPSCRSRRCDALVSVLKRAARSGNEGVRNSRQLIDVLTRQRAIARRRMFPNCCKKSLLSFLNGASPRGACLWFWLVMLLWGGALRLPGQSPVEPSFNPNANDTVRVLALRPDGRILIGGQFTAVSGITRSNIALLNNDGTLVSTFNPGANNWVLALAL